MSVKTICNLTLVALTTVLAACSGEDNNHDIILNNVTLIDAASPVRTDRSVVIRGDKIIAVNPALSANTTSANNIIDATGQYLIPGTLGYARTFFV
jgi:adenine deaminase